MKRIIELKKTDIPNVIENGQVIENATYKHLINKCLDTPPQGGWTTSVMRERITLQEKLNNAKKEIEVNDNEFSVIKSCVIGAKWEFMHKNLIDFEDYIKTL